MTDPGTRHWSDVEERGSFFGIWLLLKFYQWFGKWMFSILLIPVIGYFFLFSRQARQYSMTYLSRLHQFAGDRSPFVKPPSYWQSFKHFLAFGFAAREKLDGWMGNIHRGQLNFHGYDEVVPVRDSGRGFILIGSHHGNIEIIRAIGTHFRKLKINVLVHTHHAASFNRMMRVANPDSMINLMQVTDIGPDTAILLQSCIDRGEMVVILADRTSVTRSNRIRQLPFLGHPAPFNQGPFILASILHCPVFFVHCYRQQKHYEVIFDKIADDLKMPRKQRSEALEAIMRNYAGQLEQRCVDAPYQWFNFFDFWRADTAGHN